MRINISEGNTKIGKIPNLNLPPIETCVKDLPCYKDCYASKAFRQYPNVRKAWSGNLKYYKSDPMNFFADWNGFLLYRKPELFRIHSAGDMPDLGYFNLVLAIAVNHPNTTFLMFTKRYDFDYSDLPKNLKVYLSTWPELELPENPHNLPIAWIESDYRKPDEYFRCPGNCGADECGHKCWTMKGVDVCFPLH